MESSFSDELWSTTNVHISPPPEGIPQLAKLYEQLTKNFKEDHSTVIYNGM